MAKITMLTCDRCRAEELQTDTVPAYESVTVGLDGYFYTLDLCEEHARDHYAFTKAIVACSSDRTRMGQKKVGKQAERDTESAAVRAWARQNGWPSIGERGRIPEDAKTAYENARTSGPIGA